MDDEESKECLLSCHNETDYNDADVDELAHAKVENACRIPSTRSQHGQKCIGRVTLSLMILSLLGNAFLFYEYTKLKHAPDLGRSRFSKYNSPFYLTPTISRRIY